MTTPPKPLAFTLRMLPQSVQTQLLARGINHLLLGQTISEQLVLLNGKRLAIEITDTASCFNFTVKCGRLYPTRYASHHQSWDVCIRGRLEHFWQLATRVEDPDTLFFNRQLEIEGETATGLYLKNLLDSLDYDWDAHFQAMLGKRLAALPLALWKRRMI